MTTDDTDPSTTVATTDPSEDLAAAVTAAMTTRQQIKSLFNPADTGADNQPTEQGA